MYSIDLSDECLLQTSRIGHISEIHLCGAGSDVRGGFYQFSDHRLADYFALQFKVRAGDFGITEADAGTAGHGHRFLSLTDNMSSLLAFDRGRSCSNDLLSLCRRAAALCVGADVSWVLRHLETWRNPSDEGSRRAMVLVACGLCGALPRLNMFLELWVFRFVSTKFREIHPFRSRRARAVLELCRGDPWLSAPFRRRGAHVVPCRDLNATLLEKKGLSVVLNLISSGRMVPSC